MMFRTIASGLAAVGLLATLSSPSVASAPTSTVASQTTEADRKFEALLNAIDVVPKTRADLERLFKDAHQRLTRAALNDARKVYPRLRAITFLSFFVEDGTRKTLGTLTASSNVEIRRYAYYTAGRTFGSPGDATLVSLMSVGAADTSSEVRAHSVRALRWIDHSDAGALLERIAKGSDSALAKLAKRTLRKRVQRLNR